MDDYAKLRKLMLGILFVIYAGVFVVTAGPAGHLVDADEYAIYEISVKSIAKSRGERFSISDRRADRARLLLPALGRFSIQHDGDLVLLPITFNKERTEAQVGIYLAHACLDGYDFTLKKSAAGWRITDEQHYSEVLCAD